MPLPKKLDCLRCVCGQRKEAEEAAGFHDVGGPAYPVPSQADGAAAASSPSVARASSQADGVAAVSSPSVAQTSSQTDGGAVVSSPSVVQAPSQADDGAAAASSPSVAPERADTDGAPLASASRTKFGFLWLCEEAEKKGVPSSVLRTYLRRFQPPAHANALPDSPVWAAMLEHVVAWSQDQTTEPACPEQLKDYQRLAAAANVPESYAFQDLVAPGGGTEIPETALRGITIPMLEVIADRAERERAAAEARGEPWPLRPDGSRVPLDGSNLYEVTAHVIKPATRRFERSLVELMSSGVLAPDLFVSHWWGESLRVTIVCLRQLCKDTGRDEEATVFWICAFALRQHDVAGELLGGVTTSPFVRALYVAEAAVSVVDARGKYFKRCAPPASHAPHPPASRARRPCASP